LIHGLTYLWTFKGTFIFCFLFFLKWQVDKAIRLLAETSENQKKMNKVLQDLMKIGQMKQELGKQFIPLKNIAVDPDPEPDPYRRIRMFLGLPDPHPQPLVTSPVESASGSFHH
jgi:hypothetical protein